MTCMGNPPAILTLFLSPTIKMEKYMISVLSKSKRFIFPGMFAPHSNTSWKIREAEHQWTGLKNRIIRDLITFLLLGRDLHPNSSSKAEFYTVGKRRLLWLWVKASLTLYRVLKKSQNQTQILHGSFTIWSWLRKKVERQEDFVSRRWTKSLPSSNPPLFLSRPPHREKLRTS